MKPGGPYNKIPVQGFLTPVNNYGNLIGRITDSFNAFFADSRPLISSHETLGLSVIIASFNEFYIMEISLLSNFYIGLSIFYINYD